MWTKVCGQVLKQLYWVFGSGSIDSIAQEELQASRDALGPNVQEAHIEKECKML